MKHELYEYLKADAGVLALVASRIYPIVAPESATFPYITIQRISSPGQHNMAGVSDINQEAYQIDVWAETSPSAESVAEAVKTALDAYSGAMGDESVNGAFKETETDSRELRQDGSDEFYFRIRLDFEIWWH